jgi:SAM-dependent methyltransferase
MGQSDGHGPPDAAASVTRRVVGAQETAVANRRWWDAQAASYQAEHGSFLGGTNGAEFVWGPEGLREADAGLLGPVEGRLVVEVGCGAAQCTRWLAERGARAVGLDVSLQQLRYADGVAVVVADASFLPFADATVDIACSSYGAVQFVADSERINREVARVLKPGGRWVFSVTHPFRWCLPDDPGAGGLIVRDSYFDRRPYVEQDDDGGATYVEHHRTIGDRVRELTAAGLALVDIVEPEWPAENTATWGGWSPSRGTLVPGTAIFVTEKR